MSVLFVSLYAFHLRAVKKKKHNLEVLFSHIVTNVIQLRHLESSLVSILFRTERVINGHVLALTVRSSAIMPNSVYIRRMVTSLLRLHTRIITYWFIFLS